MKPVTSQDPIDKHHALHYTTAVLLPVLRITRMRTISVMLFLACLLAATERGAAWQYVTTSTSNTNNPPHTATGGHEASSDGGWSVTWTRSPSYGSWGFVASVSMSSDMVAQRRGYWNMSIRREKYLLGLSQARTTIQEWNGPYGSEPRMDVYVMLASESSSSISTTTDVVGPCFQGTAAASSAVTVYTNSLGQAAMNNGTTPAKTTSSSLQNNGGSSTQAAMNFAFNVTTSGAGGGISLGNGTTPAGGSYSKQLTGGPGIDYLDFISPTGAGLRRLTQYYRATMDENVTCTVGGISGIGCTATAEAHAAGYGTSANSVLTFEPIP